jgi:hypothetical protein
MKTSQSVAESTTAQPDRNHDRDRELVRAITDALVLAVGKRAAHQALRHARRQHEHHRDRQRRATELRALRTAAHLAGYSALIGYIWRQRRTSQHAA